MHDAISADTFSERLFLIFLEYIDLNLVIMRPTKPKSLIFVALEQVRLVTVAIFLSLYHIKLLLVVIKVESNGPVDWLLEGSMISIGRHIVLGEGESVALPQLETL